MVVVDDVAEGATVGKRDGEVLDLKRERPRFKTRHAKWPEMFTRDLSDGVARERSPLFYLECERYLE